MKVVRQQPHLICKYNKTEKMENLRKENLVAKKTPFVAASFLPTPTKISFKSFYQRLTLTTSRWLRMHELSSKFRGLFSGGRFNILRVYTRELR